MFKYDWHIEIASECTTNDDCTGSSDTCQSNICLCGTKGKCTGRVDTCTSGQCKCGKNNECSYSESCSFGKCLGKDLHTYKIHMLPYYLFCHIVLSAKSKFQQYI